MISLDDLPALLDGLPDGAHAFVFHSWVLDLRRQGPPARAGTRCSGRPPAAGRSAGSRPRRPGWSQEVEGPPTEDAGLTVLGLTTFRDGDERTHGCLGHVPSPPRLARLAGLTGPGGCSRQPLDRHRIEHPFASEG